MPAIGGRILANSAAVARNPQVRGRRSSGRAVGQAFAGRGDVQVVVPGQIAMLECVEWPSGFGLERLAEHLGVRFSLEGDAGPDRQTARALPELAEVGRPLFDHRGIKPFPADGSRVEPNRDRHSGGEVTAAESPGTRCSEAGHCAVPLHRPPVKKAVWSPPRRAGSAVRSSRKQSTCACTTNKLAAWILDCL